MNTSIRKISFILSGLLVLGMLAPIFVFATDQPMLLVWDSSKFKDQLVLEIQEIAEEAGMVLEVEGSTKLLKNVDPTEYSGIIIINTGMVGQMKGKVRDFLEDSAELPPTIVVTTFGAKTTSDVFDNPHPSVDALTTASLSDADEITELAQLVVRSLQSRE